jgi:hypothetical protein
MSLDEFKMESMDDTERWAEIHRIRKQREEMDARLAVLTIPDANAETMANLAADGKYICVELDSDDEEVVSIVPGVPKHWVSLAPGLNPVKEETREPDNGDCEDDDTSEDKLKKMEKRVKRKARRNLTPEFVNASFSSDYSLSADPSIEDASPLECLETVKALLKNEKTFAAVCKVLERWNVSGDDMFDSSVVDIEIRQARKEFVEGLKVKISRHEIDLLSVEFELVRLLLKNPESGWKLVTFMCGVVVDEKDWMRDTISKLIFKEDKGIYLPGFIGNESKRSKTVEFSSDDSGVVNGNMSDFPEIVDLSQENGSVSHNEPVCTDGSSRGYNPLVVEGFKPAAASTPRPGLKNPGLPGVSDAFGSAHFPKMEDARALDMDFKDVDMADRSQQEMAQLYQDAGDFLHVIFKTQEAAVRQPIKELVSKSKQGLLIEPRPWFYHRNYNKEYLDESFRGEVLPGLYLPCGSNWSEENAVQVFIAEKGRKPNTIVELNGFIEAKFPVILPVWNSLLHVSHVQPYGLKLYPSIGLPIRLPGKRGAREGERSVPYTPYSWELARKRLNMHGDLLTPLVPYMADPLLTTLAFTREVDELFLGLSITAPDGKGRFVARTRPFFNNSLSSAKVTPTTEIGFCSYCHGVYLLPCAYVTLCYYVPNGLKYLTHDIIAVWKNGLISVCAIHFLNKSKRPSNGLVNSLSPTF